MGEMAALGTSLLWSLTSIQFTLASRLAGAQAVNRVRLVLAVLFLSLIHWFLHGEVWPLDAEPFRWGWLGLSGVVGLVVGDTCLFQSFILIGPRRAMLLMTLAPVISTVVAWGWLGQVLLPAELAAILVTVGGIAWVVSERRQGNGTADAPARDYLVGVLLGVGGALGQALGLVLAKQGLADDYPSLSATLIRMLVATAAIWLLALPQKQVAVTGQVLRERRTMVLIVGGALTGPTLGVWLSMVAIQYAPVGIASTLMALSPVILIPLERWLFDERVSARAVVGTAIALAGAAALFMI
jgi:drug/metabolite transporter (DMT)-like permease